jgi:hypothetical protein
MTRLRENTRRSRSLTEDEEVELRLGPPPDRPSLFATRGDLAEARALLAELDAGHPDLLGRLVAAGPVLTEAGRRHRRHFAYADDAGAPAVFLPLACASCNPNGWRLPREDASARP